MELTQVRLENYKCFKSEKKFEFGKLTILTGANSSGKTSVITSIVSSLQSNDFPFDYSLNGDYINLGDFIEISNNKNINNNIKIGFTLKASKEPDLEDSLMKIDSIWEINNASKQPKLNSLLVNQDQFDIEIKYLKTKNKYRIKILVRETKTEDKKFNEIVSYLNTLMKEQETHKIIRKNTPGIKVLEKKEDVLIVEAKSIDELKTWLLLEDDTFYFNIALRRTISAFDTFNKNFNYISSFRSYPQRTFLETKLKTDKVSKFGDGYLDQILIWQTKKSPKYSELLKKLNGLKLLKGLRTYRIRGGRYDVRVKTKLREKYSSLSDVGFGVSQFLPIIVGDLQLGKSSTLIVLQPEIHLHPSLQSKFGDYLIEQIRTQKKKYIIETHSEYLINKIRLGIVKGNIKKEDVCLYYLENEKSDCDAHKIELTETGEIKNAPNSFFSTYMMDLKEITLQSMKKR